MRTMPRNRFIQENPRGNQWSLPGTLSYIDEEPDDDEFNQSILEIFVLDGLSCRAGLVPARIP